MPIIALVFLLIFFLGCAAALFIDASYGIFLYFLEYFFHPPGRWWGASLPELRYAFSAAAVTAFSFLMWHKKYSENRVFDVPQSKWLILFCIIIVLTWPIAVDKVEHEYFMGIFIKYVLLYLLMIKIIDTPLKFEKLMGVFLLGQFYLGWIIYEVGRTGEGRVEGMGTADAKDANVLAAIMVVSIPFLIHYLVTGKIWQRICSLVAAAFILNGLILINSRGAFLAILISVAYYTVLAFKMPFFSKFNKMTIIAGIVVGSLLFLYLADTIFWERMATISETPEDYEGYTGRERIDFWIKTFDMLKDYPFGVGAMGYERLSPRYLPVEALHPVTGTRAVHSTYFEALASYGYHGFFVFLMFLLSNIVYIWKLRKSLARKKLYEPCYMAIAIESAFIAHLIAAVFINRLYSEILYWSSAFIATYGNIHFKMLGQSGPVEAGNKGPA